MKVEARHHWVPRALAPRETRIGGVIFFLALDAASYRLARRYVVELADAEITVDRD